MRYRVALLGLCFSGV